MLGRSIVLLAAVTVIAACTVTPFAARAVHPPTTTVTASPTTTASPDATPTPTPSPPPDTATAEPVQPAPTGATAAAPPPRPVACAASAAGTLTILAVRTATGQASLFYTVDPGCPVTVLVASNYTLHDSFTCSVADCRGYVADNPPAAAGATGVTYTLSVTDATGQSRTLATAKGVPFGPPSPIPVSPFPSPSH